MKTKLFLSAMTLIVIILITGLNSCTKVKQAVKASKTDPQSAKDYVTSSSAFTNVFIKVNDLIQSQHLLKSNNFAITDSCPKIISSSATYPKIIKMIFDTINGCYSDGNTYKGIIIESIPSFPLVPNSVVNISFKNFSINGNKIDGVATFTDLGKNPSGKRVFNFAVTSGTVTTTDGIISYATTQNWTWLNGESTVWPDISDDEYQIEGQVNGISTTGHHFTAITQSPILLMMGCQWKLVSGIVQLTPDSGSDMTIDFGDATCDDKAVIKISGLADINVTL